ncbi:hypothetical protein B0T14DRAFT_134399 [Immersiella caudata]|uniref:Uncharacterized protein n=1 Tax=Immersiella caudata TaxID=314043 RepID=A0AA39X4Y7_9PEZI|nr:hypothetical protein B0T14DRAFT_134399 [Immersiella caudata]
MEPKLRPCLCKISSTSRDGKVVGVLSIYPCLGFAHFWRTLDIATAYYQDAEKLSAGWIARYEVWSVDETTRIAGCDIPLSPTEILLLLRQSFRESSSKQPLPGGPAVNGPLPSVPGINGPPAERGAERCDQNLEISFPASIGHDCRTVCLLRTIYNIRPSSENDRILRSYVLPLQNLSFSGAKWTSQLSTFDPGELSYLPEVFRAAWRDWYTYSLSFSPDGRYLCFADYQKPCITQLAVFEVSYGARFEARLVHSTMVRHRPPRVSEMKFHPRLSLLAFLSENKVWIWDFLDGK